MIIVYFFLFILFLYLKKKKFNLNKQGLKLNNLIYNILISINCKAKKVDKCGYHSAVQ